MKLIRSIMVGVAALGLVTSCNNVKKENMQWSVDRFADAEILRYRVDDFEKLSLQQKEYLYYLSEASLAGRDILFDQNGRYNLAVRRTLEAVYENYKADTASVDYKEWMVYLKRVWFSNGIHHHYANDKLIPGFSNEFLRKEVSALPDHLIEGISTLSKDSLISLLSTVIFDPGFAPLRVNQKDGDDIVVTSACNYYQGITQQEAENFYQQIKDPKDQTPISYGLNSRLVKENGKVFEKVWKVGGLYSAAIEKVVSWLEKAQSVAENDRQKQYISSLINYYRTGDLKMFDQYCIEWVQDTASVIDFVNGFTETYGDPLGMKASWEAMTNFKNTEATKRTEIISNNAQWFEDNSPIDPQFKKESVKGISAKVITAAILGGDCYPTTPIGINLPNSNWIRRDYGSKSVTIENITYAYDQAAQGSGFAQEFVFSDLELESMQKYGFETDNLHTNLHECLGHGSGKLAPGVDPDALKVYGAPIEETRADLFGLYYMADPKMVELGLLPDKDAYKAAYYRYLMNGLMTQLVRITPGKNIEQAHMRNRSLIAHWVLAHGITDKVVEMVKKEDKIYVKINDYTKLRDLFGQLLNQIQTIRSTGNYQAAKQMVETYGVKVNPELHKEILARYAKLNLAPYKGFVNPVYDVIKDKEGKITDVRLLYQESYLDQMMRYSKQYSYLPTFND